MHAVLKEIIAAKIEVFKEKNKISLSWFDVLKDSEFLMPRYQLIEFGSTLLGVENADSDLDILVTTFDCLYERIRFYQVLEAKLKLIDGVSNFIAVKTANIPLAKFSLNGVKFDLVFADIQTPHQLYRNVGEHPHFKLSPDYLI